MISDRHVIDLYFIFVQISYKVHSTYCLCYEKTKQPPPKLTILCSNNLDTSCALTYEIMTLFHELFTIYTEARRQVLFRVLGFPPLLQWLVVQPVEYS